jgi:PAS domain S-box-containing protein
LSIAIFMGMGVFFSLFHGRLRKANQQAAEALAAVRSANDQLEAQVLKRTADLQQTNVALRESDERFRVVQELSPDGFTILRPVRDAQGRVVDFTWVYENATIARLNGTDPKAVVGRRLLELFPGHRGSKFLSAYQQVAESGGQCIFEEAFSSGGGSASIWFRIAVVPTVGDIAILAQDITERKRAEVSLQRSNRALRMISECNQALVHAATEADLLQAICRTAVEYGGYCMAWVGFAEQNEAKSVRPVAQAGFEAGYLDTVDITWSDTERGRGPTGMAIRTGRPVIARDIPTDPAFVPWRAAAIQRGYASLATLPLISGERVFGALMVYAGESDAFNAEEIALLTELAGDLAYGITALRTRAERARAEAALRENEARIRNMFEQANDGIYVISADNRYLEANARRRCARAARGGAPGRGAIADVGGGAPPGGVGTSAQRRLGVPGRSQRA